ncbi:unnamed protein product, partial [marine sediment metagenome]
MHAEARHSFGNVITPNRVDNDVRAFLASASKAGDDRFVLGFCADLRDNGIVDPFCVELETNTLAQYHDEQKAIRVLSQVLEAGIDEFLAKQVRLDRSLIALRVNEPSFVEKDIEALPSSDEATPEIGAKMVALLCEDGRLADAAEYAYTLFRRYPHDHITHMAVIRSLGLGTGQEVELPRIDV